MNKKSQKPDTSNIIEISDMSEQFLDSSLKIQLEKFEKDNVRLTELVMRLESEIDARDQKIKHLEELLRHPNSYLPVINKPINDEEEIALAQLERLKDASKMRPLSLEEVRIYDLLVKNKRLAQGEATDVIDTVKLPKDRKELIKIATTRLSNDSE